MQPLSVTAIDAESTLAHRLYLAVPRISRWLVIAYALAAPVLVLRVSGTEFAGAGDLLAPVCCATVLIGGRLRRLQPCHLWMLVLWVVALVSLLSVRDGALAEGGFLRWVRLVALGAPLFLSLVIDSDPTLPRQLLRAFFWGGLCAILAGWGVYWLQIPIHPDQQQLYFEGGAKPMFRAGGLAGNTGIFGHLVATWAVLALGLSRDQASTWRRNSLVLLVLAVTTYSIWVCSSRSACLNVVVAGIYSLCLLRDTRQHRASLGSWLGIVLPGALLLLLPASMWLASDSEPMQTSLARFMPGSGNDLNDYASGRLKNWSLYLSEVESHPLLGAGYKTGYRKFHGRAPDNSALSILYETGIFGLAAGTGLFLTILVPLSLRGWRGDSLARLLAATWMGQLAHGMTADIYTFWLAMPVLYLLTGLALSRPAPGVATNEEAAVR